MAGKKNIRGDEDTIYGDVLRAKNQEVPQYQLPVATPYEDAPPAQSQWSTGRNCPKDAGQLVYFELNQKTGVQWYECRVCRSRYTENELNYDELYRMIPKDMILRHVENMKRLGR